MVREMGVRVAADSTAGRVWLKLAGYTGTSCTVIAGQVSFLQTSIDSYTMPSAVQIVSLLSQLTLLEQPLGLIDIYVPTSLERVQKQSQKSHLYIKPGKYNSLGCHER